MYYCKVATLSFHWQLMCITSHPYGVSNQLFCYCVTYLITPIKGSLSVRSTNRTQAQNCVFRIRIYCRLIRNYDKLGAIQPIFLNIWCRQFSFRNHFPPTITNYDVVSPIEMINSVGLVIKMPAIRAGLVSPWAHHDDVIKWKHFRVTGHLCGEFTGPRWITLTKASDADLWCLLWSASE